MRVILDVIEGPQKSRQFVLDRHDTFIVGRSRFVHCSLPEDPALSLHHFLIEVNPPRCEVRDLGSTKGTFVNGRRVERMRLVSGDRIAAGTSIFQVGVEAHANDPRTVLRGAQGEPTRCAGCGIFAPPDFKAGDVTGWLCEHCRAAAAAMPQLVPHYTVLADLGRDAKGVVYKARHRQSGRLVALKLLAPECAPSSRSDIERFYREMSVISQLTHPTIVEVGMSRGQFWFAMEYVPGAIEPELML
jgi:serine/threonine-protein kinase